MDQDEEYLTLVTDCETRRLRLHDYAKIYKVPGLYEEVVYNRLKCDSPRLVCSLLEEEIEASADRNGGLRALDFGAGNGIVGDSLDVRQVRRHCHRIAMSGDPIHYHAVIGQKRKDISIN